MNIGEFKYVLLKNSSDFSKSRGKEIFSKGLVEDIKGKKVGNNYNIYGKVLEKDKGISYTTYIKVNMATKKLDTVKCSCSEFRELSLSYRLFMCSHLIATSYKFIKLISNNIRSKSNKDEIISKESTEYDDKLVDTNKSKIVLEAKEKIKPKLLPTKLVRKIEDDIIYYEAYLNPGNRKITIETNNLKDFLAKMVGKKVRFRYEYLEFNMPVLTKDLPLVFTLKIRDENLVLTTHKQFPISLDFKDEVFMFNSTIYIPSKSQIENYKPLYEKLKQNGEILYNKDIKTYNYLINILNSISTNIIIRPEVIEFFSSYIKPKIILYKENDFIYSRVSVYYGNIEVNLLSHINNSERSFRDYKKEERIIMDMERNNFIKNEESFLFIGDDEDLFNMLNKNTHSLNHIGNVILDSSLNSIKILSNINLSISYNDGFINISYSMDNDCNYELNEMFIAYKNNLSFYKTKNNNFIDLEAADINNFFSLIDNLGIENDINNNQIIVEENKAFFINEILSTSSSNSVKGLENLSVLLDKFSDIYKKDFSLPKDFNGTLREYQEEGFKWFGKLSYLNFGGILADEMGLGKTIQTIAFLLSQKKNTSLIVAPTSLIYNWDNEISLFAPTLKVGIIHGSKNTRLKILENLDEYDILLTTYGTLRLDMEYYTSIDFQYLIIDEAQNIKNPLAQNTLAVKRIKSKVKFALTGTPIENNLVELWSIFDFIMPGYLYTQDIFQSKFLRNDSKLEDLKLLIKPFILRRTKKEVIKDLPDKIEKKLLVSMTPKQEIRYKSYIKLVRDTIKNNNDIKIEIFSYLTKLRQICLDPTLIDKDYTGGSGKLKVAVDLIFNHIEGNNKLLLFSQFTSVLDNIGAELDKSEIKYFHLDGSTKPKERIKMVDEFNSSNDVNVFLISLKAGGTGLNLTSANLVIHFDPWWNPAVEDQATDRAHRIGQKNIVEVIKLVAKNTIEEKILLLQEDKKNLINDIMTGDLKDSNTINKLTREEIIDLFNI